MGAFWFMIETILIYVLRESYRHDNNSKGITMFLFLLYS